MQFLNQSMHASNEDKVARFAALQSAAAKRLITEAGLDENHAGELTTLARELRIGATDKRKTAGEMLARLRAMQAGRGA